MPDMTRSRYFFNSSIIRQNFRQHGWIGIIYALGLLFALPLQMFMSNNPNAVPQEIDHLFRVTGEMQMIFIVSIPVVAGLFLFYYLQTKSPSDMWHSLPLRREHLLTSHLVSGLLLLLIPVWLTAAVVALVRQWGGNLYIFQGNEIWSWCIAVTVLTLFLFCLSVFVGICSGQSVLQGIIIYALLLLPSVGIFLMDSHLSMYLYGYPELSAYHNNLDNWSPFIRMMNISGNPFSSVELWIYGGLSALFIGLSYLLYRKRHSEKAGQAIAFVYFNPLFKAGIMICCMLIAGNYFAQMKHQQIGWVISGYAIGAIVGYIAAEMIIRKTWQIVTRKVPVEFAIYTALLGLLLYIPASGLTGYENRVPSEDKISGVFAGSSYWMYNRAEDSYGGNFLTDEDLFSKDKQYIEAVRKLHQAVATIRPENKSSKPYYDYNQYQSFTVAYSLDNGREMLRRYLVPLKGFEPELKAVMESEGFKRAQYAVSQLEKDIDLIRINNSVGNLNKQVVISDPAEITEFKAILKKEILSMSFDDQTNDKAAVANISPIVNIDGIGSSTFFNYSWSASYHELEKWMEEKGYADKVRTNAEDVESAKLVKIDHKRSAENVYDPDPLLELAGKENQVIDTEDKAVLADILKQQRSYSYKNSDYLIKMVYKGGYTDFVMLKESDLTPGLKALLK
ncbi:DUF6449 domain-containing protein [Paenibacillus sp. FSL R10-2734]|uniref:DUF6449 domain-containing protein n=1 Tax=Paenibacillus sp. FSL R10-2734 TaxID=2954691 RepID=UPI0030D8C13C